MILRKVSSLLLLLMRLQIHHTKSKWALFCVLDIREEFIAFLQCKWGLSGENLAKPLLEVLNDLDLPIENCRGQGYDGAGSVAGCVKGLAAQILRLNPKALYMHCYSLKLVNL
jgi:hypothetical protein